MTDIPEISVVVATCNRAEVIPVTLRHLAAQSLAASRYEVIVVDDGSTDNTEDVVRQMIPGLPYRTTYLRHANRGVGYTQNRGIEAAQAPLICLLADDIFLAPQALEAFLEAHRKHPEPQSAFLGQVRQSPELVKESVFLQKWDPFRFKDFQGKAKLPYYLFWACNISCKREFLLAAGLFREHLGRAGYAAHEDVELGYRLHKKGLQLYYCPEALGLHHHFETLDSALKKAYMRGLNWQDFRDLVDDPAITVHYHIFNRHTLKDHIEVFTKNHAQLMGWDRNPFFVLLREAIRLVAFNAVTVRFFWLPIMHQAETSPLLAKLMEDRFYRGVLAYHMFKGVLDAPKVYGAS